MAVLTITDLDNAKLDVDHISAVATSTTQTATDRLGNVKPTVYGAVNSLRVLNPRGAFAASTTYNARDVYTSGSTVYVALSAHTSTSVATDLAAGKVAIHQGATREELAATGGAGIVGYGDATVSQFLNRSNSKLGRASAADLPRFMAKIRAYRHDLQAPINIVGFGSSVGVGASLPNAAADAPVAYFKARMKAVFDPGNLYNLTVSNQCVNGSSVIDFPAAWAAMLAAGITTPGIAVLAYGMNDQAPASYNAGQTLPGFYNAMRSAVLKAKNAGWDVVIMTTPHPSIVRNPGYHSMPAGIAQVYPTSVAANVAQESMSPPASASTITADFVGEGVSISINHRGLRINHAMRDIAKEFGCALIDSERYWFEALQKYQIQTGSASGAEALLYNPGEIVHPNLLGHQESYHKAINDFVMALSKQVGQSNTETPINGYSGVNLPATYPAAAVFEVHQPYPDETTPPVRIYARTGQVQSDGVKAEQLWIEVDPTNGDLMHGGGAHRLRTIKSADGVLTLSTESIRSSYGVNYREKLLGDFNASTAPIPIALPDNATGEFQVSGQNTGIGGSPHTKWFRWATESGVLTLAANGADIGSGTITVAASGLSAVVTPVASNTNVQIRWTSIGNT